MSDRLDAIITGFIEGETGPAPVLKAIFESRAARDEGRYCECADPLLEGHGLMCGRCLLHNKELERRACARICDAHDFVPGRLGGMLCAICTMGEDAPRHHGIDASPRYSWDQEAK